MVAALSVQLKKKKQQRPTPSTTTSSPSSSSPSSPKGRSRSPTSSASNSTASSINSSPVLTAAQRKKKKYREKKKQINSTNNNNTLLSTQATTDSSDFDDSASEKEMPPTATTVPGKAPLKEDINFAQNTPPNSTDSTTSVSSFKTAPAASRQVPRDASPEDEADPKFFDSVDSLVNLTDSIARVGSEQIESKQGDDRKVIDSKKARPFADVNLDDHAEGVSEKNEAREHHVESLAEKIVHHEAPSFADVAAHRESAPDVSELPPVVPEDIAAGKAHQDGSNAKPAPSTEQQKPNNESRPKKMDEKSVDITTTLTEKIEEHKAPDFASVAANKARVPEEVKIAADIVADQVIAAEKQHIAEIHNEVPPTDKTNDRNPQAIEHKAIENDADVDIETPLAEKISEQRAPRFSDVAANKAHVPEEVNLAADIVAENVVAAEKQHIVETTVVDTMTPLPEKIEQHRAPSFASVAANKAHVPVEVNLAADITADEVHAKEEEVISSRKIEKEIDTETPLAEKIMEHRAPSFADVAGDLAHVPEAVIISADLVADHVHDEETKHLEELHKQRKAVEEKAKEEQKAEEAAKGKDAKSAATQKQRQATGNKSLDSRKIPIGTLLDRADVKLHATLDEAGDALDSAVGKSAPSDTPTTPTPSTTSTVAASPSTTPHEPREIFVAHNSRSTSTSGRRYSTGETEAEYAERRRREQKLNRALENRRKLGPASLVIGNGAVGALLGAITAAVLAATGGGRRVRWLNNVTKTRAAGVGLGVGVAVGAAMGLIEWIWLGKRQSTSAKNE